jgi:hypothetical protein
MGAGIFAAVPVVIGVVIVAARIQSSKDSGRTILTINDGQLVLAKGGGKEIARTNLADLVNVTLDSKEIFKAQRVVRPDGIATTGGSLSVDVARIVLVRSSPHEPITLSETFISKSECLEWFGKIRVFLRKQDWLPEDERESD